MLAIIHCAYIRHLPQEPQIYFQLPSALHSTVQPSPAIRRARPRRAGLARSGFSLKCLEARASDTESTTMATEASKETANKQLMEAKAAMLYARPPDAGAKYRKPNQTRGARQRKEMIADFVAALGGSARVSSMQMHDVARAADLVLLASTARAELAAGKTTVNDAVK